MREKRKMKPIFNARYHRVQVNLQGIIMLKSTLYDLNFYFINVRFRPNYTEILTRIFFNLDV